MENQEHIENIYYRENVRIVGVVDFVEERAELFSKKYSVEKDVIRLADILGHSNVDTTRIYTMETGEIHRKQLQRLGLLIY